MYIVLFVGVAALIAFPVWGVEGSAVSAGMMYLLIRWYKTDPVSDVVPDPVSRTVADTSTTTVNPKFIFTNSNEAPLVRGFEKRKAAALHSLDPNDDQEFFILDTETTGLGDDAEIIEIAIVRMNGSVVMNTFVKPRRLTEND